MGLKNFKNDEKNDDDEYKALMCSVHGCPNRWSVKIDAPMCSFHQWGSSPVKQKAMLPDLPPKTEQWYDKDSF